MNLLQKILISICFGIFSLGAIAQATHQENIQIANAIYNEGLYDSALNIYHEVEKQGFESSELYYNLGNAYFKNNDIAHAILYYERAKKLSPNDEDIEYNLGIANSMIVDKIEKVPVLFYKKWWNYFYNLFDADTWTILSILVWMIFVVLAGIFLISKSRSNKILSFYLGVFALILALGSFGLASQKYYFSKEQKEAIVFTPTITVKSSPTLNAVDLFVVHEGTKIRVLDHIQGWIKIKIADGSVGWLPEESLQAI